MTDQTKSHLEIVSDRYSEIIRRQHSEIEELIAAKQDSAAEIADQSEQVKELEHERAMIFSLLKQLRVNLYNMANDKGKSDLEFIYETNTLIKDIDYMFLHGYLQDSETKLTEIQEDNTKLREHLSDTVTTIERQIELISIRATGDYLDKRPVVQALNLHLRRAKQALASTPAQSPPKETP